MSPAWQIGFAAAALVVVVVAVSLLYILAQAMRIRRLAVVARDVVAEIENNTRPVWQLQGTLAGAKALEHTAIEIGTAATRIANVVDAPSQRNAA
jgi:hypothetical protein